MIFFFLTIFTFRHFPVLIPVPYNSYKIEFSPHQYAAVSHFLGTVSLILCLLLWLTIWTYSYLNLTVHKVVVNVFISHGAWRSYFLYFLSHSLLLFFHSYFMFPYLSYNQPLEWNPSSTESTVNILDFVILYIYNYNVFGKDTVFSARHWSVSLTSPASEKALSQPASLLEKGLSSQKKDVLVMWKEFPSRGY